MALWCGYVIATTVGTVYVAGDTGYGDGRIFLEVAERRPVVDVAVLPIGAYAPRWFMKDQHVNPAGAVRIMQDCGAAEIEPGRFLGSAMGLSGTRPSVSCKLAVHDQLLEGESHIEFTHPVSFSITLAKFAPSSQYPSTDSAVLEPSRKGIAFPHRA
jgi:Beta-lactamase superfamily domain